MSAAAAKKRIGEMLLDAGIIDETQLKAALGHQRQWGVRLGQALVDLKLATEADIVRALSLKFGFEVARLDNLEPYGHEQALKLLPREFTVRSNVFPMWADTANLTVAMSDPSNLAVVDEIQFRTGRRVKVCIGGDREVAEAVKKFYPGEQDVQAIPLDLDADQGVAGEAVFGPFVGGSRDALEAFFGGAEPPPQPGAAAVRAAPAPAAAPATSAPARPGPRTAAGLPAQPAPAQPGAPRPQAVPRPGTQPALAAAQVPPRPGTSAGMAAQPAAAPRPAAPARPAAQPAPAAPRPGTFTSVPAQPGPQPASRPATAAGVPAQAAPAPAPATAQAARAVAQPAVRPGPAAPVPAAADARARAAVTGRRVDLELEEPSGEVRLGAITEGADVLTPLEELPAAPAGADARALTQRELSILESLDRLAGGAPAEPDIVKPAQAMAALIRLLIRKRVITEQEFLDELSRK